MEYTIYCCFPHTRGKFTIAIFKRVDADEFPPYAGEVYNMMRTVRISEFVSPIRGGSLPIPCIRAMRFSRFPHTRGKFTYIRAHISLQQQFPPYAGEVYYITRRSI